MNWAVSPLPPAVPPCQLRCLFQWPSRCRRPAAAPSSRAGRSCSQPPSAYCCGECGPFRCTATWCWRRPPACHRSRTQQYERDTDDFFTSSVCRPERYSDMELRLNVLDLAHRLVHGCQTVFSKGPKLLLWADLRAFTCKKWQYVLYQTSQIFV